MTTEGAMALSDSRAPVDHHTTDRRTSQRLLARLLKYHGDHPPDNESRAAVMAIKKKMFPDRFFDSSALSPPACVDLIIPGFSKIEVSHARDGLAPQGYLIRTPTLRDIINSVCKAHGVSLLTFLSSRRLDPIVKMRQEAMWRMSKETTASLPQMGKAFRSPSRPSGLDHTTILYGIRKHQARIDAGEI